MFPSIKHIRDVSPYLKEREEFALFEGDGYSVIDYNFSTPETFGEANSIYREFRGIMFDAEGNLISRPFHKFFNYGEKPEEDRKIDWAGVCTQEKLDGSMVRPVWLKGQWTFCTRKGVTEVAQQAQEWFNNFEGKLDYEIIFHLWKNKDNKNFSVRDLLLSSINTKSINTIEDTRWMYGEAKW